MRRLPFGALLAALVFACGDPVGKGWLVERTRVLAARISAVAEPGRATLAPGERARVTWLVVGPAAAAPRVSWTFAACERPAGNLVESRCEGALVASGSGTADGSGEVPTELVVPHAEGEILVLAAFCDAGEAALDPKTFTAGCTGGSEAVLASTTMRISTDLKNRNPEIASDAILLDGAVLPPSDASTASCATVVTGSGERTLGYRFRGDDREQAGDSVETLILSHVVTAGTLDRLYSALEPGAATPTEVTIPWSPPDGDRAVQIYFVLRDGRGGTAFTRRTVCVRRNP